MERGVEGRDQLTAPAIITECQTIAILLSFRVDVMEDVVIRLRAIGAPEPVARPAGGTAVAAEEPSLLQPARLSERGEGTADGPYPRLQLASPRCGTDSADRRRARRAGSGGGPMRIGRLDADRLRRGHEALVSLDEDGMTGPRFGPVPSR